MNLPRTPEELLPYLAAFGTAIATGKLLASRVPLTLRAVAGRAIEGAALAMCASAVLLIPQVGVLKDIHPVALLGLGGLLASLGVSGLLALVRAVRGGK